jgi:hypothetical protein
LEAGAKAAAEATVAIRQKVVFMVNNNEYCKRLLVSSCRSTTRNVTLLHTTYVSGFLIDGDHRNITS